MAERPRRALPVLSALAALLLAGCAPTVVAGAAGGPFATTTPSPTPTPSRSSPSPSPTPTTPSPTPTPTPTPTLPPLSYDSISLDNSVLNNPTLGFLSPAGPDSGWVKTLAKGGADLNRTFYDNAATGLHVTVEVDLPTDLTALDHARQLDLDKQTTEAGYHLLALGPGPLSGATWAFTSSKSTPTLYVIDWFNVYPAFGAAILVQGPVAAKALVKALWLAIVESAYVPTPYSSPGATTSGSSSSSATGADGATLPPGLADGGTG